jgi:hypothetical protein
VARWLPAHTGLNPDVADPRSFGVGLGKKSPIKKNSVIITTCLRSGKPSWQHIDLLSHDKVINDDNFLTGAVQTVKLLTTPTVF